jgi:hypothetical protein
MRLGVRRIAGLVLGAVVVAAAIRVAPGVRALLRSTDQFVAWPGDARVRYEPGAEQMAEVVAAALPDSVRTVEARQYRSFARPPTIFVCASLATFASYGGDAKAGGYVLNQRLFLSPKPENTVERIPRVLTHELSHLHIEQQLGAIRWWRGFPTWFQEGLAAFVSDGGGAENASEDEARRAIATGQTFAPVTTGGLFHRPSAHTYGMTAHLFYREGAMFFGALKRRDEPAFRRFLLGVEDGAPIEAAFEVGYGETLAAAWARFVAEVRAEAGS